MKHCLILTLQDNFYNCTHNFVFWASFRACKPILSLLLGDKNSLNLTFIPLEQKQYTHVKVGGHYHLNLQKIC